MLKGQFRLEERDVQVLLALEKWGVLGWGQLDGMLFRRKAGPEERTRLFFNEIERKDYWQGAYKRLRRLEIRGFIRQEIYVNQKKVFLLTGLGHKVLRMLWRNRMRRPLLVLSERLIKHELKVSTVGLMLTEFLGREVTVERERFAASRYDYRDYQRGIFMPDLWVMNGDAPRALEIELEPKSKKRYEKLWNHYRVILPPKAMVLYLTGWPHGAEWIMKQSYKFGHHYFIFAASLDDFRQSLGQCGFACKGLRGGYETLSLKRDEQEKPQ